MQTLPIVGASVKAPTIYDCFYYNQKRFEYLQQTKRRRTAVLPVIHGAGNLTFIDGDSLAIDLYRWTPAKGKVRRKWMPLTGADYEVQVQDIVKGGYISFDQKNFYHIQTYLAADDRLRVVLKRVE